MIESFLLLLAGILALPVAAVTCAAVVHTAIVAVEVIGIAWVAGSFLGK